MISDASAVLSSFQCKYQHNIYPQNNWNINNVNYADVLGIEMAWKKWIGNLDILAELH